jgi:hypothetical protein
MSGPMIRGGADVDALLARMTAAARKLGEARAMATVEQTRAGKWRKARLLWPLFGQE